MRLRRLRRLLSFSHVILSHALQRAVQRPAYATFEVFLTSSGSYDAAKESERDLLVYDENGVHLDYGGQPAYGKDIASEQYDDYL